MSRIYPSLSERIKKSSDFHKVSLRDLQTMLQVDITKGLSWQQVNDLQKKYGKNQLRISYANIIKAVFFGLVDYFSLILWFALVVSILLFAPLGTKNPDETGLINTFIILACFIVKSILIAVQEYNTLKSAKNFISMGIEKVNVLRESKWSRIPASEIVVGDVVEIRANHHVPADMRLFSVNNLRFDKSILTGESEPIEAECTNFENVQSKVSYYEAKNMAFMSFYVLSGSGQGIVVSVLNQSYMKEITKGVHTANNASNRVNRGLNLFALFILLFALALTLIYILIWAVSLRSHISLSTTDLITNILDLITTGIPIGLPVSITAGLLIVLKKLNKSEIVVKSIFDIPWMSNIDVVLTDKTGTLTYNSIRVTNVMYSTKEIDADLCIQSSDVYLGAENGLGELLDLCDFCTADDDLSYSQATVVERVLYEFARKNRPNSKPLCKTFEKAAEIEFNSRNKFNARLIRPKTVEVCESNLRLYSRSNSTQIDLITSPTTSRVLMVRGAPDFLIYKCKYVMKPDGSGLLPMDSDNTGLIISKIGDWSIMGKRLLCLCKKVVADDEQIGNANEFQNWFYSNCSDMIFVGLIGFMDSPRPE